MKRKNLYVVILLAIIIFCPINMKLIAQTSQPADTAFDPELATRAYLSRLAEYRKVAPGPVEEWLFFDHPSCRNRILMAMRWKAENLTKK